MVVGKGDGDTSSRYSFWVESREGCSGGDNLPYLSYLTLPHSVLGMKWNGLD